MAKRRRRSFDGAPSRVDLRAIGARISGALLLGYAVLASPFLDDVRASFQPGSYREKRVRIAFGGADVDGMRFRLGALLPADRAVALAPSLAQQDFLQQRLTEGLYPRSIDPGAPLVLEPVPRGAAPSWRVLGAIGSGELILSGELERPRGDSTPEAPASEASIALSAALVLVALLGLFGSGLALVGRVTGVASAPLAILPASLLAGGLLVAWSWTFATWTQWSLGPGWIAAAAAAVGSVFVVRALGHPISRASMRAAAGAWLRSSHGWALGAFALLVGARLAAAPIALWDVRSIWLFHARRIWQHGAFLERDALSPAAVFSHPDHPLFFPSWLAFSSALADSFDERLAGLGIAALWAALLALSWSVARRPIGSWPALALTLALAVSVDRIVVGGYADGPLCFLLLIAFLALVEGQLAVALVAAACASLTKLEGLPLAVSVLATAWILGAAKKPRARQLWLVIGAFAPALGHLVWTRAIGLGEDVGQSIAELLPRLRDAWLEAPALFDAEGYTGVRAVLRPGLLALLAAPILLAVSPSAAARRRGGAAFLLALFSALLSLVTIALRRDDIAWLVQTALDRLLVHSAAFALLACLLALAREDRGGREGR
jgi:hypothetical protein